MLDLLEYGVKKAEILGAELVQGRFDDESIRNIMAENKVVRDVKTLRREGIGISAFYRGSMGYLIAKLDSHVQFYVGPPSYLRQYRE